MANAVFGMGTGALIMTVFGFVWFGWGFSEVPFTVLQWIVFYAATLCLLAVSFLTLNRGKAAMKTQSGDFEFWKHAGKRFGLITAGQGLGCGLVLALTLAFHRLDLLALGISFVVGLHFIPMGKLFRFPAYFVTAAAILSCNAAAWLTLPPERLTFAAGVITGAVLWITAVYALARAQYVSARTLHADA